MNDAEWPTSITLNLNGTIHGVLLGLETYLPKHKSGSEGLIVNISSVAGICPFAAMPIYAATKFAVHGLTLSWGLSAHYNRTKVRVVGVCPGSTVTPLLTDLPNRILSPSYEEIRKMEIDGSVLQKPEQVAPGVMQVIEKAPSGTMWVIEGGAAPYQYKLPKRDEIPKVHL